MEEVKQNCVFYESRGNCKALTSMDCCKCSFYKPYYDYKQVWEVTDAYPNRHVAIHRRSSDVKNKKS